MRVFKLAITTQNAVTNRLSQEVVDIIADDYHSALDKYRLTIPNVEKIIDVHVF